jgi:DNA ligase (NAD+)
MEKLDRVRFLVLALNAYTKDYDEGNPKITDEEWDNMYFELQNLEQETGLILPTSPTQTIHYEVVNALAKSEHNHKMLSLDKTKSLDEVASFLGDKEYLAMLKMDGLTCSVTYRNGELVSAETRGNGLVGEDVLHNAMNISGIPRKIPCLTELTIDGEIICTYTNFEKFSGDYKNPRNFAAGSIRLLDSKECASRGLKFIAWDVITSLYFNNGKEYSVSDKLNYISDFGFWSVPKVVAPAQDADGNNVEIADIVDHLTCQAKELGFPIDGIVFKFNNCAYGRSLGETTHHFKNALAYKFYDETYWTRLLDIEWTMGRTGVLTPVAIFEPIDVDGSTVERASLHNCSIISELFGVFGPHKYQEVEVFKANMIIPQIKSVKSEDLYIENKIEEPTACPVCGGEVAHKITVDSMTLACTNPACPGKLINRLDHFCGKKGLDMKGISKATLEKLIDWGWVSDFTDIFELSIRRGEWVQKPGFGAKSVEKVLNAINTGANCELHQFIAALGIPLIGSTASKELAKYFETWEKFVEAAEGGFAFYTLPNFGSEMHNSIVEFNYAEARLLADHYIHFNIPEVAPAPVGESLAGKTFVITGKLTHFKNRDEIKARIEALGGKVTGSVSKNTNFLINNDVNSTSSKNATAKSLGIPILSESDFIQTFGIE